MELLVFRVVARELAVMWVLSFLLYIMITPISQFRRLDRRFGMNYSFRIILIVSLGVEKGTVMGFASHYGLFVNVIVYCILIYCL